MNWLFLDLHIQHPFTTTLGLQYVFIFRGCFLLTRGTVDKLHLKWRKLELTLTWQLELYGRILLLQNKNLLHIQLIISLLHDILRSVIRKPTPDRYLRAASLHHPTQKKATINRRLSFWTLLVEQTYTWS